MRLLTDDIDGERHERFIIRLESGQTLLVAHNIGVASRVERLEVGDGLSFGGVYEWSAEGGTIHWTHLAPKADTPGVAPPGREDLPVGACHGAHVAASGATQYSSGFGVHPPRGAYTGGDNACTTTRTPTFP